MKKAEPLYSKSWDELQSFYTSSAVVETLDDEFSVIEIALDFTRQQIRDFIEGMRDCRQVETASQRHKMQAEWVLEQLPLIEKSVSSSKDGSS